MPNWQQPSRLSGYDHWETHDPDEAVAVLSQNRRFRQEVPTGKGFWSSSNTAELEWLTFSSIYQTRQKAWCEADARHYHLLFWNLGWNDCRNGRRERVGPGDGLLSTPHRESTWESGVDRDVIAVLIPSRVLLKEAANLAGGPLPYPLELTGVLRKRGPIWRLVDRFLGYLESGVFKNPSLLRREWQRRLITDLVLGTPHNIPLREERATNAPPFHKLRADRAKEITEAHPEFSLGDVAQAIGATARSLQRAFQYSNQSWREERWKMRMHAARQKLSAPEENTTVHSVAEELGFHGGRFPAQYRQFHGEYPHVTLQRGRLGRKIY